MPGIVRLQLARFSTEGLDELFADLTRYDQMSGPTADKMLLAGAEAVKQSWREEAERRTFRDTRSMINQIGFPKAVTRASDIASIDIYPQGTDKRGTRNAEKAFILHWGTDSAGSKKRRTKKKLPGPGIPRTLWVDVADKAAGPRVIEVYTRIWDEFLKGKK